MKCKYGCGQEAKYILKNKSHCCSDSSNKCPENRSKNSIRVKESRKIEKENGTDRSKNLKRISCQYCSKTVTTSNINKHEPFCYLNPSNIRTSSICENCGNMYDGKYASGRFCSSSCSHSFPTKKNRDEINRKVSIKLKERVIYDTETFDSIYLYLKKIEKIETKKQKFNENLNKTSWGVLSQANKRLALLKEQQNRCVICSLDSWNNKPIKLHLDHINGNRFDERKENLRMICPNCHSQTETYCSKNQSKNISDELIEKILIENNFNIAQTINQLGMSYGSNFYKCKRVLDKLIN